MAQTSWVTVRDTREQAFSIDVPKGWTVHGGMFRLGPMDPRPVVDMKSPDGKTEITIGDPILPAYAFASTALARLGLTESKVMMSLGTWPVIARYRPVTAPGPGGLWGVNAIGGFLTPVTQATAIGELPASMNLNPAWGKAQARLVNAVAAKSTVDLRMHLAQSHAIHQQG